MLVKIAASNKPVSRAIDRRWPSLGEKIKFPWLLLHKAMFDLFSITVSVSPKTHTEFVSLGSVDVWISSFIAGAKKTKE